MGAFDKIKGLSPAMQGKYWHEAINREGREHLSHSLNPEPHQRRSSSVPIGNKHDFYANSWSMLSKQHVQAAGCPSALVTMARHYTGEGGVGSRPLTGASGRSGRSQHSQRPITGASGRS